MQGDLAGIAVEPVQSPAGADNPKPACLIFPARPDDRCCSESGGIVSAIMPIAGDVATRCGIQSAQALCGRHPQHPRPVLAYVGDV